MRLIKLKEVMHITSLARSTIYKFMGEGSFPKSVSLGDRAVAWVEEEVQDWMMEKIEGRYHSFKPVESANTVANSRKYQNSTNNKLEKIS